jgi:nitrogen regulatory protein PII
MKAIFIVFNQANTERIEYLLDRMGCRGFTWWETVQGRGSVNGEPRKGTHTWPEMNSAVITVVPDDKVDAILARVKKIDAINEEIGIKAFVWNIETMV